METQNNKPYKLAEKIIESNKSIKESLKEIKTELDQFANYLKPKPRDSYVDHSSSFFK